MLSWQAKAWEDYLYWQKQDKKTLKRINTLLTDIVRDPHGGIGKAEPLRAELAGCWSRRIDETNRLVYIVVDGSIIVLGCRGHYD